VPVRPAWLGLGTNLRALPARSVHRPGGGLL